MLPTAGTDAPSPRSSALAPALGTVLALALAGCGASDRVVLPLADYVDPQAGNVDTDLIRPLPGRGLERVGSGWLVRTPPGAEGAHLELSARLGRFSVFSLAGDVVAIELEATLDPVAAGRTRHRINLRLNDRDLEAWQTVRAGRHRYRFELPSGRVAAGENLLELSLRPRRARATRKRASALRVHGFAVISGDGRPPRRERPDRIVVRDTDRGETIEMPGPSRLDLVAPIPAAARLDGRIAVAFDGPASSPMEVRIELRDEAGGEHLLYRRVSQEPFGERLGIDLAAWSGRLARLRVSFAGDANAVLGLQRVRVEGRGDGYAPPPPPVGLRTGEPSRRLPRSDVVFVLLDAARADAFSPWGSPHPTPVAERLAAGGTRFARARSPSSWTGQSIPAIFTGIHPDTLGMEHWGSRLPDGVPTLAERFRDAGYRTVLWTQHPFYRSQRELQRGFGEVFFGRKHDPSHLPTAAELLGDGEPLFAFVHLMPPHTPYEPPPPFRGSLTSWYTGDERADAPTLNAFPKRRDPSELGVDDLRYLRGRYQENVAYADALVGQVLALLDVAGRYDDALVVLLSDHGEAFLEHGRFLHGLHLYGEFVHVPLIVKWPATVSGFAEVVEEPVGLVDLAPSLVEGLALEPGLGFQGDSLLGAVFDARPPAHPVYAYTRGIADGTRPSRPKHLLESGGFKVIVDLAARAHHLYRPADDPGEQSDLAPGHPLHALLLRQQALMQAALNQRILDGLGGRESRELDPETIERLKALGYL